MERLELNLASLKLPRGGFRFRSRQVGPDPEQVVSDNPPSPPQERSLASYVPSAIISTEQRAFALVVGGAPAWSRRLRRIERLEDAARAELAAAWRQLAHQQRGQPATFDAAWHARANTYDFSAVNELIRRHNLYFPAEANLRMSIKTGDYVGIGGGDYRRQPLDATWVLNQFPPDLAAALETEPMAEV